MGKEKITLTDEVLKVIKEHSRMIAKYEEENYNIDLWNECQEFVTSGSPIEQILYCALMTVSKLNSIKELDDPDTQLNGLSIIPQRKIGKYRIDFEVYYRKIRGQKSVTKDNYSNGRIVLVECDSQQFHERTERERRYEKARDRFLISKGYKIFHFTGAEIMSQPFQVACEILAEVTDEGPYPEEIKNMYMDWISEFIQ